MRGVSPTMSVPAMAALCAWAAMASVMDAVVLTFTTSMRTLSPLLIRRGGRRIAVWQDRHFSLGDEIIDYGRDGRANEPAERGKHRECRYKGDGQGHDGGGDKGLDGKAIDAFSIEIDRKSVV